MEDAHVWFVRFSMDFHCRLLACGTRHGRILIWDPNTISMHPLCTLKRGSSPKMTVRDAPLSAWMESGTRSCLDVRLTSSM